MSFQDHNRKSFVNRMYPLSAGGIVDHRGKLNIERNSKKMPGEYTGTLKAKVWNVIFWRLWRQTNLFHCLDFFWIRASKKHGIFFWHLQLDVSMNEGILESLYYESLCVQVIDGLWRQYIRGLLTVNWERAVSVSVVLMMTLYIVYKKQLLLPLLLLFSAVMWIFKLMVCV